MTPLTITKSTGGKTMPIGMTIAAPECTLTEQKLQKFANGAGVNAVFLANQMSAYAAHERGGLHLYRMAAGFTQFNEWRARYQEFGDQTEEHIRILSDLIKQLGGDPQYVSPVARMDEFMGTKLMEPVLLAGSVDRTTQELACLEAVLVAERKCHSNWETLRKLTEQLPDSAPKKAIQRAVQQVEDQEDTHVQWAKNAWQQMILAQMTQQA